MGRNSPAAVRAAQPRRDETVAIDGLPSPTIRAIRELERTRLWPGAVATALRGWRRTVHGPRARLFDLDDDCPCCDRSQDRMVLERAMTALGGRPGRDLRAAVDLLDEVLRRRTHHDATTPAGAVWWHRRV
ncbi:hypothetical protein ACWT_5464 [Actinoplanes sp. SE50]|uniref:hypothetical protein n=1 Tax=unclassified Actinoplanes TaxID=2626549 RepID=UPI00023EC849|nr:MULTISPECIES: hypothetical protein [unclassified Actinoplanes]AEV86481.1 hypothetical protein ACPL_5594 [Actinoplanes sp. SE50/110]ATO84879.1 hypothetical protein ACWT_5464 [Actinoplanes sp. SE50]SLM02288.1 hypothetical protein ACSP50_5527 [Actinoplanes sp. SE50/110]